MSRPLPRLDLARHLDMGILCASITNSAGSVRTIVTSTAHGLAPGATFTVTGTTNSGVDAVTMTVATTPTATSLTTSETFADAVTIPGDGFLHALPIASPADRAIGLNLFHGPAAPGPEGEAAIPSTLPDAVTFVTTGGGNPPLPTANRGFVVYETAFKIMCRSDRPSAGADTFGECESRAIGVLDDLLRAVFTGYMRTRVYTSHPEYEGEDENGRHIQAVRGAAEFSYTTP